MNIPAAAKRGAIAGAIVGAVLGVLWVILGVAIVVLIDPIYWVFQIGTPTLFCAILGFVFGALSRPR